MGDEIEVKLSMIHADFLPLYILSILLASCRHRHLEGYLRLQLKDIPSRHARTDGLKRIDV